MRLSQTLVRGLVPSLAAALVLAVTPQAAAVAERTASQAGPAATPQQVEQAALANRSCDRIPAKGRAANKRACVTLKLAKRKQSRVRDGDEITLKGKVRHDRARSRVLIQELRGGGRFGIPRKTKGKWKTVERIRHDGRFRVTREVSWGHHVYRAKVRLKPSGNQRRVSSAAAATSATSATTSSTAGSYGYGYVFANDTGRNLKLTYTGSKGKGSKSQTQGFKDKSIIISVLRNPPKDFASAFRLKGKELGIKETYKYDGSSGNKPCAKAKQPKMGTGDMATVVFKNKTFGYKGRFTYPDGKGSCTFQMLTSVEKFFAKQGPWAILLEIAAAVVIVAVVVALTVVTDGADLPELAEAATGLSDGGVLGGDVVSNAGEIAEEVSDALEEELPNITKGDGWPPIAWTDGEIFGNTWKWVTVPFGS